MAESMGNVFHNIIEKMHLVHEQLKGGEGVDKTDANFCLQNFWLKMCLATKCISNEVTKLCLAFSKPPFPLATDARQMMDTLETAYLEMVSTFYSLPKASGLTLRVEVHKVMLQIAASLITVVTSLKETGEKAQKDRLVLTGCVWDACEAVEGLSQNNLQATCKIIQGEEMLVLDALQELQEEVATYQSGQRLNEEDNCVTWSNQDQELLSPCLGLVKTARSCLKKVGASVQTRGKCETEQETAQLDDLVSSVKEISPAVDDLVSSMYPPMNRDTVKQAAVVMKTRLEALLHRVKQSHYVTEEDHSWLDFLSKAVSHNNNKLQPLLT